MGVKERREEKVKTKGGIIEIIPRECSERNIIGGLKYKMHNRHNKKKDGRGRRVGETIKKRK